MGILFAVTALLAWGLGDFLIEKSARKFGNWIALFYISAFGAIVLFPFVYADIGSAFASHAAILWITSFIILISALFNFEALRVGKISVVEPIFAFEVPVAGFFAAVVIGTAVGVAAGMLPCAHSHVWPLRDGANAPGPLDGKKARGRSDDEQTRTRG